MRKIVIHGRFESLNAYVNACRSNWKAGASMVRKAENKIIAELKTQMKANLRPPVRFTFSFYEPNKARDKDNIAAFFHKVWFDSLQKGGWLENDSWDYIGGWYDDFYIDKNNPRIEVVVLEKEK